MAVTVRITETYDLKTTVNKMGIIGVHTPSSSQIRAMYPGLVKNHRFVRFKKCDVFGACASVLPADPQAVGISAGDVAPEDMFNPILYRPVSNDSFDTIVSRIYDTTNQLSNLSSVTKQDAPLGSGATNHFNVYYSLLAESKRWKKAMPQRGFSLRGLYPICYTMINTFGNAVPLGTEKDVLDPDSSAIGVTDDTGVRVSSNSSWAEGTTETINQAITFRGKPVKMPRFPMHYGPEDIGTVADFPTAKTYVCAFIIPPARLHEFYYRMRVTWTISFEGLASATEFGSFDAITGLTGNSYQRGYTFGGAKTELDEQSNLVDANDVDVNLIMKS